MLNTFSGWLFNLMFWGSIVALVMLLYATLAAPELIHNGVAALVALGVIAVVSVFWPKF